MNRHLGLNSLINCYIVSEDNINLTLYYFCVENDPYDGQHHRRALEAAIKDKKVTRPGTYFVAVPNGDLLDMVKLTVGIECLVELKIIEDKYGAI